MEKLGAAKEENVCVDTDVVVDFLRRREPGVSIYNKYKNQLSFSTVTAFELLYGAKISSRPDERVLQVRSILEKHGLLTLDLSGAESAAAILADLRTKGKIIEIRDLFNAAICLSRNMPLLTRNKRHYERVAGLRVLTS